MRIFNCFFNTIINIPLTPKTNKFKNDTHKINQLILMPIIFLKRRDLHQYKINGPAPDPKILDFFFFEIYFSFSIFSFLIFI
jgi:hypothetical protein